LVCTIYAEEYVNHVQIISDQNNINNTLNSYAINARRAQGPGVGSKIRTWAVLFHMRCIRILAMYIKDLRPLPLHLCSEIGGSWKRQPLTLTCHRNHSTCKHIQAIRQNPEQRLILNLELLEYMIWYWILCIVYRSHMFYRILSIIYTPFFHFCRKRGVGWHCSCNPRSCRAVDEKTGQRPPVGAPPHPTTPGEEWAEGGAVRRGLPFPMWP